MADEAQLVAALAAALAPVPVYWGWAPFESAEQTPTLPIAVVRRTLFSTDGYTDMCTDAEILGDTTLVVHVWAIGYGTARLLCSQARDAVQAAGGWVLQSETDNYDTGFRAWQIEGQWVAGGVAPT